MFHYMHTFGELFVLSLTGKWISIFGVRGWHACKEILFVSNDVLALIKNDVFYPLLGGCRGP